MIYNFFLIFKINFKKKCEFLEEFLNSFIDLNESSCIILNDNNDANKTTILYLFISLS